MIWRLATPNDLAQLVLTEQKAYAHPWSLANFQESLASGYRIQTVWQSGDLGSLLGYSVTMPGVDEAHLLNLTVSPSRRRQGLGRQLLTELCQWSAEQGLHWLWLEVRVSNAAGIGLYESFGLCRVGQRKSYYPSDAGQREDAIVMNMPLAMSGVATHNSHP